jgi:Anticodon-binding domain
VPLLRTQASPRGQACFDRLLKACNEVVWKDDAIVVLHQIRVDPPYTPNTCTIISKNQSGGKGKALDVSSLERVRKIVESEPTP